MNGPERFLRVAQCLTQRDGIGEIFLDGTGSHTTEHRQPGVEIVDRFGVGHGGVKIEKKSGHCPPSTKTST